MIELKILAADAIELQASIFNLFAAYQAGTMPGARAAHQTVVKVEEKAVAPKATKAKPTPEKEAANDAAPVAEEITPEEPKAGPVEENTTPEEITYPDIQTAVKNLAAAKGRNAVIDVLDTFGVDHASKLQTTQWAEALEALVAKLGE